MITDSLSFADHHSYSTRDLDHIVGKAKHSGAGSLITTDKDYVRLKKNYTWPLPLLVLGVAIEFTSPIDQWKQFLSTQLAKLMCS